MFSLLRVVVFTLFALKSVYCYRKDGKCYKSLNMVIIVDASGSIEPAHWNAEIDFAKQIVQANNITDSGTKFAVVDFSTDATVDLSFNIDASKARNALDTLKANFKDGHSVIDAGLNAAVKLFEANPSGNETMNVVVIITDGYMTFREGKDNEVFLKIPKDQLTAAKVVTYAVGVGEYKEKTLQFIASDPAANHVFKITDGTKLTAEIQKAAETSCESVTERIKCTTVYIKKAGVGCYKDGKNPAPLPDLILTDRDTGHPSTSGVTIDWDNWGTYMPDLICRCAEKAASMKRKVIGLQNYGECWSSEKTDTYAKDGVANEDGCKTFAYENCKSTDIKCVGQNFNNFVYLIDETR